MLFYEMFYIFRTARIYFFSDKSFVSQLVGYFLRPQQVIVRQHHFFKPCPVFTGFFDNRGD